MKIRPGRNCGTGEKIRPVKMTSMGIVALTTVILIGYYLLDIAHQFGH